MHKATAPSKIEWSYSIAVRVDSLSMKDLLSDQYLEKKLKAEAKLTMEERVQDQLSRSGAQLHASVGRWNHYQEVDLPPEWEQHTRDEFRKLQEQKAAYEALPAKERKLRAEEALVAAEKK